MRSWKFRLQNIVKGLATFARETRADRKLHLHWGSHPLDQASTQKSEAVVLGYELMVN